MVPVRAAGNGRSGPGSLLRVAGRSSAPDLVPAASGLASTRFEDYRSQVIAWSRDPQERGSGCPRVLVGASLGGLLALSVAAEIEAAALVLVNPMPPAGIIARPLGEPHAAIRRWGSGAFDRRYPTGHARCRRCRLSVRVPALAR